MTMNMGSPAAGGADAHHSWHFHGNRHVDLLVMASVGNSAVQPTFSDGLSSGLYTCDYLYLPGSQRDKRWQDHPNQLLDFLSAAHNFVAA
jgi:DUF971 family protein